MSFDVRFKATESSEPVTVGYSEFKAMIQQGELGPKCLVSDRVLTGNEWWPLDELKIFHTHSPVAHPPGDRLRKKQDDAKYWDERTRQSWAQLVAYTKGDLIERSFQLVPLPEQIAEPKTHGASRLYVLRAFEPERIFTFIFESDFIRIAVCQGRTSLWASLPQVGSTNGIMQELSGPPFEVDKIYRASGTLRYEQAPELFKNWISVTNASQLAPSCSTQTVDGVTFRHQLLLPAGLAAADWSNPYGAEHAEQIKLLKAYRECIVAAKLECFWQGRSPEPLDPR